MVGVLVVTHGHLAEEFLNSASMLVGSGTQMGSVCLLPGQAADDFYEKCESAVKDTDSGSGILALVDIPGGTPNNTMYRLAQKYNIRVVTGVNLPMVLVSVLERTEEDTLEDCVANVLQAGPQEIMEFGKH